MGHGPVSDPINSYALVSYIPGRLGEFITRLRQELVSGCVAKSHVTILPPRPLHVAPEVAGEQIRARVTPYPSFELNLPRIRVFEQTSVVFCEVGSGRDNLFELHDALNVNGLAFEEPWEYHPHVTLAQGVPVETLPELYETAMARWREELPPTSVLIDVVTFVQNTEKNVWIDLEDCELRGVPSIVTSDIASSTRRHR